MIKAKEEEKREKAELKQARFDARNATKLKAQKKKDDAEAAAKAAAEAASLARTSSKKAKEIARNALRSARRNLKALVNSNEAVKLFGVLEDGFDVMEDGIEWVNQELPEPELRALKEALQTKLDADGDQARRAAPHSTASRPQRTAPPYRTREHATRQDAGAAKNCNGSARTAAVILHGAAALFCLPRGQAALHVTTHALT